jgi:hypothetical protein
MHTTYQPLNQTRGRSGVFPLFWTPELGCQLADFSVA